VKTVASLTQRDPFLQQPNAKGNGECEDSAGVAICPIPILNPGEEKYYEFDLLPIGVVHGTSSGHVDCDQVGEDGSCANNDGASKWRVSARQPAGKGKATIGRVPASEPAAKLTELSGTASAGKSRAAGTKLKRVQVALLRTDSRCRWLTSPAPRFRTEAKVAGQCTNPTWVNAKGTAKWRLRLRGKLPPGRYEAWARAIDGAGRAQQDLGGRSHVTFRLT
jgi:hypothetical protein